MKEELTLRKTVADALTQSFGLTSSSTPIDLLWLSDEGTECVLRVQKESVAFRAERIQIYSDTMIFFFCFSKVTRPKFVLPSHRGRIRRGCRLQKNPHSYLLFYP